MIYGTEKCLNPPYLGKFVFIGKQLKVSLHTLNH